MLGRIDPYCGHGCRRRYAGTRVVSGEKRAGRTLGKRAFFPRVRSRAV